MNEIQASRYSNPYGKPDRLIKFLKNLNDIAEKELQPEEITTTYFYPWGQYEDKDFYFKPKKEVTKPKPVEVTEEEQETFAKLHNRPNVQHSRNVRAARID